MNIFNHFILTKFNVSSSNNKGINEKNAEYLSQRFSLFDDFCYPSVFGQTIQNFKWLVFFNSLTPDLFKERISKYREYKNFIPVYVEQKDNLELILRKTIQNESCADSKYIITTNMDNDDSIARDFVKKIQQNFKEQDREYLSFIYGYELEIKARELRMREYLPNPFVSLVEKADDFKTVWSIEHSDLMKIVEPRSIKFIVDKPLWLQVIHTSNVSNKYDVNSIWQPIERAKKDFIIEKFFQKTNILSNLKEIFVHIYQLLRSKRKRDRGIRKIRKIIGILSPSFLRTFRLIKIGLERKKFKINVAEKAGTQ